ncbi:putative ribonuclease H-like domain-containing protein [Tanacetum coccineum]
MERELGEGYSFTKKKCFVCGSLSHLIKDCDYYEKKMEREAEFKKQRVFNTGNMVAKPVWTNTDRINHANQFVPRPVQLNTGRPNINSVRTNINTDLDNQYLPGPQTALVLKDHREIRDLLLRPQQVIIGEPLDQTPILMDHPLKNMVDRGIFDSGCSGHMTGNKDQLEDFEEFNGGSVTFEGSKGYITGKGRIRVGNLDFDSVSLVKKLGHFNLFLISQICDKQYKVLFTETECLVVSSDFKMPDENQILLKVPRHHNMYSFDMKTPTPAKGFACLIAKATSDESKKWHRRLGHINFKNLNKLVKGNLVRGLPSKVFRNDHTCVACHKGKQHRASCKAKLERIITEPLHTLHMDLFGPTSVKSINHASYCLVITDDCTRFSWVFFLATKDETSGIIQNFIRQIENQLNHRVKIIRSDNGTGFKNRDMLEFCRNKGIKQEYSNARTPQQNGVAERMNRTLIEAARTMLADSLLPTTFWAEAVSTACYIFNRVRVTKPQNKTPYELLFGHKPMISYIRPFGCHVAILDTLSVLGKFDGKFDEGFLVSYSLNRKAYRVYNLVTKRVEVNLHVNFLEDKPNVKGVGYRWMFDIDYLTDSMNYIPISLENQANPHAGTLAVTDSTAVKNTAKKASSTGTSEGTPKILAFRRELEAIAQKHLGTVPENNTSSVNSGSEPVNTGELDPDDSAMPELKIFHTSEIGIFYEASYDEEGVITDFNSLPIDIEVSPTPTLRIHNIHPKSQILGDPKSAMQTKSKEEPKRISEALQDDSWVQAMQEELLQFKLQQARLVAQGHRPEEGIDYDKVFALVARIVAIRLFLAFASFIRFIVYQMDVKSAFLYGTIDEEVYVSQPPGFVDPGHPKKVYKVVKALYGLHQAPRAWYATLLIFLEEHGYKRGTIDKTLFIKKDKKDIMLVQVYVDDIIFGSTRKSWYKYVADMLKKFDLACVKTAITPMETKMALTKDEEGADVDVNPKVSHLLAMKRIFKYLKSKPNLGLWYPRESPFDLEAFSDSDYGVSNLDRKSITGGCQFLGQRLISWQCKKQTIVATSTTEAEYVAAVNCCGQVLWVQNQLLDYGFNFMNTKIHIDNESTICIVKNPMYHSKTKHIEIHHHFIRDCYEKKLIRVKKIHTDLNVAHLLTKPFDGPRNSMDLQMKGRYALATNPTIYDSLVKQFWQNATATTLDDGTLEIKAIIDTIEYTITEPSIRSKLQSTDVSGITMLPNDEIFEGMGHMGGFRRVSRPLLPAMLSIANPSAGQEPPSVTQPQPSSSVVPPTPPSTQPIPSEATTIPPFSQPAPPTPIVEATNASPSPTPSPAHLIARIDNLEKQLKETKQTFGKAILTLVERVKTLEVALKRKTKRILLSDSEEEEIEAQGRKFHDLHPLVSLLQELVTPSKTINASGEEQVENISPTTLEAAAILTKVKKIKSVDKGNRYKRRKSSKESAGTGLDFEEVKSAFEEVNTGGIKVSASIKEINAGSLDVNTGSDLVTIDSIRASVPSPDREEAGLAEAIRLDALEKALEKEEVAKQVHLDSLIAQRMAEEQELTEEQKKRKAQVQFEAQSYTEEDWDTIRAKLEANAELKESVLGKDLTVEDYAKRMVELVNQRRKHFAEERARAKRNKPMTQTQLRNYMSNFLKNQGTWKLTQLKKLNFEEVKAEFEKLVKQLDTYVPMNFEATKESLKRFGEELQTKTAKKLKFDDEGTQPTEEKIEEDKDDKPTKKTGKRRKQIARKGFHTDHDKDEAEDSDEANEKDDSTSGTKIPINPVPVATKSPSIANYKIIKQGRKGVYQIVRENGTDMVYISFGAMLTDISRDDLTELYRIVMKKHGMNEPEDEFEKELGHEYKFITEIVAQRANGSIVSIIESDYKNLNKNDIEDMYLLIERVHDFQLVESYQENVNHTASTITFPGIEKFEMFSIVIEPVCGIIYENNKKEKSVMRHQEIHKLCDATLKRVMEGLKSYNNDVKYGYVSSSLSKEDAEYLQLFGEDIEVQLKYHDQMRHWEIQPIELRLSQGKSVVIEEVMDGNEVQTVAGKKVATDNVKEEKLLLLEWNDSNQDGMLYGAILEKGTENDAVLEQKQRSLYSVEKEGYGVSTSSDTSYYVARIQDEMPPPLSLFDQSLIISLFKLNKMTTLAKHIIDPGAKNRPPMLEKSMYDLWASHILLFIKGKKHGRMMLDSINNVPLVYPTVEENGHTRLKKYSELTEEQKL